MQRRNIVILMLMLVLGSTSAQAETGYLVTLPIKIGDKRIAVAATVNATIPVQVVLDTGSGSNLLPVDDFPQVDNIAFGGITFQDTVAYDTRMSIPDATYFYCLSDEEILIGTGVLGQAIWQIDYQKKTLTITDTLEKLDSIEGAFRVPISIHSMAGWTTTMATSLGEDVMVVLDTGSPFALNSTPAMIAAVGGMQGDPRHYQVSGRIARLTGSDGIQGRLADFQLGDLALPGIRVDAAAGAEYPFQLIGNSVFEHFVTTFDYLHNTLYLYPQSDDYLDAIQAHEQDYGFAVTRDGNAMKVMRLVMPSPASEAGLKMGDTILQINDQDYRNFSFDQYCPIGKVGGNSQDAARYFDGALTVTVERGGNVLTLEIGEAEVLR
jgi:hypothetical protein